MTDLSDTTGQVISLPAALHSNARGQISMIDAYWHALRQSPQDIPKRTEIDPRALQHSLPWVLIAERIAPGHARLRVAGSALSDLLGMEVRGMPATIFIEPAARRPFTETLEQVFTTPAIAELVVTSKASFARPRLEGRLVFWPLASDLGDIDRVLGCLCLFGSAGLAKGRAPRRFIVETHRLRRIPLNAEQPPITGDRSLSHPTAPAPLSRGALRLVFSQD